jgi:hypothetical protein
LRLRSFVTTDEHAGAHHHCLRDDREMPSSSRSRASRQPARRVVPEARADARRLGHGLRDSRRGSGTSARTSFGPSALDRTGLGRSGQAPLISLFKIALIENTSSAVPEARRGRVSGARYAASGPSVSA